MKKALIILATIVILASCAGVEENKEAFVTFRQSASRDVSASITYPAPQGLVWTVTAVKNTRGTATGAGTYNDVLLTDTLGPFSTGTWTFTFDSDVYHGEVTVELTEGDNSIDVNVVTTGETGTLRFENCCIPAGSTGVYIDMDDNRIVGMGSNYMTAREYGGFDMPVREVEAEPGIHDITVTYNGTLRTETFKVRIVAGLVTTVSFGIFEGSPQFNVIVNEQEALVDE